MSVVVKLSSIGKGYQKDYSNARYIARFDTLADEMGNRISKKDIAKAVSDRISLTDGRKTTSFRVIVSLPNGNELARRIVEDVIRERYISYLSAFHSKDGNKEQWHLHFLIFNDIKNHELSKFQGIFRLKEEIEKRFEQNNIKFKATGKNILKINSTQAEKHIKERGERVWKDEVREIVKQCLFECKNYDNFVELLNRKNVAISRITTNSLTLEYDNKKVRLNRLFSSLKNRGDIENFIKLKIERRSNTDLKRFTIKINEMLDKTLSDVLNNQKKNNENVDMSYDYFSLN